VISRAEYEDAELLMALREELNHDGNEYSFTDDEILGPFGELHCVTALPPTPLFDESDEELLAMQKLRYQQVVRSTMMLSLTELISRISLKKPFRNQRSDPVPPGRKSAGKAAVILQTTQKQRLFVLRISRGTCCKRGDFFRYSIKAWLEAIKSTVLSIIRGTPSPIFAISPSCFQGSSCKGLAKSEVRVEENVRY
jgi:hypothetical protein